MKDKFCEDCEWAEISGRYIAQTMENPAEYPELEGCRNEEDSVELLWELWEQMGKAVRDFTSTHSPAEFCREYKKREEEVYAD